jgi:hypothetical protein
LQATDNAWATAAGTAVVRSSDWEGSNGGFVCDDALVNCRAIATTARTAAAQKRLCVVLI